jgi:hypothetical protein
VGFAWSFIELYQRHVSLTCFNLRQKFCSGACTIIAPDDEKAAAKTIEFLWWSPKLGSAKKLKSLHWRNSQHTVGDNPGADTAAITYKHHMEERAAFFVRNRHAVLHPLAAIRTHRTTNGGVLARLVFHDQAPLPYRRERNRVSQPPTPEASSRCR